MKEFLRALAPARDLLGLKAYPPPTTITDKFQLLKNLLIATVDESQEILICVEATLKLKAQSQLNLLTLVKIIKEAKRILLD